MNIDNEANKVIWSLQNNKRTEEESNLFKPTGKKPKKNGLKYVLIVLLGLFSLSFIMTQFAKESIEVCFLSDYCINSSEDKLWYTLYVFITNVIIVFGVYFAYRIGKYLASKIL